MKKRTKILLKRAGAITIALAMSLSSANGYVPQNVRVVQAAEIAGDTIANNSLRIKVGDLGQIAEMNIVNNRINNYGNQVNFVLPNDSSPQNNENHQWMGEMIFSYRTSKDGTFPEDNSGFTEVDTNKTMAAGGTTTCSDVNTDNPYIEKKVIGDKKVEVTYKGLEEDSDVERAMKGFNVSSVYDMETKDGSLLWNITLKNTSENYIEFGDVGLPMPWNNKYPEVDNVYNERVTAHTFAGADSGYAYAIRCSGEGNYMLFTPVPESGARIEYVDNWIGYNNGVTDNRADDLYSGWTADSGGWQPGLSVYYIHSKDIQKTGRGYYEDATSLVLKPGEEKTYQFKFSAVRAGDNSPQSSAEDHNNASDLMQERENNLHSILYQSGMIDAIAVPSFQTAINMDTQLDLHYDETKISDVKVDIQCVHENDPYDEKHIPEQKEGAVSNARTGRGLHDGNEGYEESCELKETKVIDGESHHIYNLNFGCIGNNSVRVNYKLKVGDTYVDKFTEFEFNVLTELKDAIETHSDFVVNETQDKDPNSETFGIYSDWYFASGKDSTQKTHWGDDWSHDNINFMTLKNYLDPDPEEVKSIEYYLIDYMWENYMKNTHDNYMVANYLDSSGIYSDTSQPYTRTFSEVMEATGFFNMYRIEKAYPDLIEYREPPEYYLEKAYNIYMHRVSPAAVGFYGEQQIPDMIEALRTEGMTEEAQELQVMFAKEKGSNVAAKDYPYVSEFPYDNTGEEGTYAAAKSLLKYYPDDENAERAKRSLSMAEWKTRAMRGIQPTWYQYADPVFLGGESWWNFQYTASLAGSIMDDYLRYQNNEAYDNAWAARVNYAAKISNFNAINMGQISDKYVGNVSWRYNMYKGGYGAMNVNDGGTRVMNNGWNDFSGESDEGLYGSLLRISSDVVNNDPIFGLVGYGCKVTEQDKSYTVTPRDGIGKRINLINEKVYVELMQDECKEAVISKDGTSFELKVEPSVTEEHLSQIDLSGVGIESGYYSIAVNGEETNQVYVNSNHEGSAYITVPGSASTITITKKADGNNEAPVVKISKWTRSENVGLEISTQGDVDQVQAGKGLQLSAKVITKLVQDSDLKLQALVPFELRSTAYDDGAGKERAALTYQWEVVSKPENGELTFTSDTKPFTEVKVTIDGKYVVKLTVSDGEKKTEQEIILQVGEAPEKKAPEITLAEGEQDDTNTTIANLQAEATPDSLYEGTVSYEWTVEKQPENGNAVIASAKEQKAVLKVSAPGEYVVRVTARDGDKTSYKDITIVMNEKADGIWREGAVITQVNVPPTLPSSMSVITSDGSYQEKTITWDEIAAEKYATVGEFEVLGTIEGSNDKAAMKVVVVTGKDQNVAFFAQPSGIIDDVEDLGGVKGLNDGYDPTSSRDTSHGVWHNWRGGAQGDPAWVMYTWDTPTVIYATDAYYFTDGNFAPKDVVFEYLDEEGNWKEVLSPKGLGVELNQYNHTEFMPVRTTALRMTMTPKTKGCGVIEWKVSGYSENVYIDKKALIAQVDVAKKLKTSLFEENADIILKAAIEQAQKVLDNEAATQEEVDNAVKELGEIIVSLPAKESNLAYNAGVSTSFVSSWERLGAVNDGNLSGSHYGSWGNTSKSESVTYTWAAKVKIKGIDTYFWYDGVAETEEEAAISGGIKIPKSYTYEYLDEEGNWKELPNLNTEEEEPKNATWFVKADHDEIQTTALRLTMEKQEEDGNGVGLWEWKVYGTVAGEGIVTSTLKAVTVYAEGLNESDYSKDSWEQMQTSLEQAKTVLNKQDVTQQEVDNAVNVLSTAIKNLSQQGEEDQAENLALEAKTDGVCNYDGEYQPWDQGGLPKLKDGIDPNASNDLDNGSWFNWNDRKDAEGNVKTPWVSYTWDKPVILDSTDIYYFSEGEGMGHELPQSVTIEYLDENGTDWKAVEAVTECKRDQYNTTSLGKIRTTALRLTLTPQSWNEAEVVHGVGIIEWKVMGTYAEEQTSEDSTLKVNALNLKAKKSKKSTENAKNTTDNKEQEIEWSVIGNTAEGTVIDENGYLTVDEKETEKTITIKAVLKEDPTCASEISLKVVPTTDNNDDNNNNNNNNNNNSGSSSGGSSTVTTPTDTDQKPSEETPVQPGKDDNIKTETKPDGTVVETKVETAENGNVITTVTETKPNGDITETKTVSASNDDTVLTIVKQTKNGQKKANAVISAGAKGTVVITENLLDTLSKDKDVSKYTLEIASDTVNAAPKKTKNTIITVDVPFVDNANMDKIVCTKDGLQTAKATGKGLKIIVNMTKADGSTDSSTIDTETSRSSYVATIPAKQLQKIDNSVETLTLALKVVAQQKLKDTNNTEGTIKTKLTKSGSNAGKAYVISTVENTKLKNVGIKFKIDVVNNAENVDIKAGNTVYIYKYNTSTKKFEEMAYSKQVVAADGTVDISGYSGMNYIVSAKKLSGNSVTTIKQGIKVKVKKNTIKKGKNLSLKLTLPDTISTKSKFGTEKATITYKSNHPKIASVSKNGVIKAKKAGKATITTTIKLSSGQKITKTKKIVVK